jgi:5-methylcytosine-specific restriction protein B
MARCSEHDTTDVYAAAERFRDECLHRNGSLLTDGKGLWTPQNLARLHQVFVTAPVESDRSFIDKKG